MPSFVPYPGLLRERVTLQRNYPTKSTSGSTIPNWVTLATVRAAVRSESSREYFAADKSLAEVSKIFYVWKGPNLTSQDRLLWGARVFTFDDVVPLENNWLEIHAKETR